MGRAPCCDENGLKKGPWTPEEDQKLIDYIQKNGHGSWRALPKHAGLLRCGKSCRLRWTNYLRPDIKRGKFSFEEEQTILQLHAMLGNKWSAIAAHLPGRTDNEIKNYWNTHLKKRLLQMGIDPMTHRPRTDLFSPLSSYFGSLNPWDTARLEAEARLRHYLSLAAYRSSNLLNTETGNINLDLNLLRSACQLDEAAAAAAAATSVASQFWVQQQQHTSGSLAFNAAQNLDPNLVHAAQATSASSNFGIPDLQQEQGSVTRFLDNMCSLALGCTYSAPLMDQGTINPPPSDSCITEENLKESTIFSTPHSLKPGDDQKVSIPKISYNQDEYTNNLPPTTVVSSKAEIMNSLMWPDHKYNSLPPLVSTTGSPRSSTFNGSDMAPDNASYGGSLPPELLLDFTENSNQKTNGNAGSMVGTSTWSDLNTEDGKDYWSNVLKLVDTGSAGSEYIIRHQQ